MALAVTGLEVVAVGAYDEVIAVGDTLYACSVAGRFAASRDGGATWLPIDAGAPGAIHGLALAPDGAVWLCGDAGYLARMHGGEPTRVDLGTTARLVRVYAARDEVVVLGDDGAIRRWSETGVATAMPGGMSSALAITARSWIAVGRGGFIARSPDGVWYSRVTLAGAPDLVDVTSLRDGRVIAVGARAAVVLSTDDGRTWAAVATGIPAAIDLTMVRRWQGGAVVGNEAGVVARLGGLGDDGSWQLEPSIAARTSAVVIPALPGTIDVDFDFDDDDDDDDDDGDDEVIDAVAVADDDDDDDDAIDAGFDSDHEAAAVAVFDSAPVVAHADDLEDFAFVADLDPLPAIAISRSHTVREEEMPIIGPRAHGGVELAIAEHAPDGDETGFDLDDADDDSGPALGWQAVERALDPLYHGAEPFQQLTGEAAAPLHAVAVYRRDAPTPHFHVVTYGFTELYDKDSDDLDVSGYGFELSLRVARRADDEVPGWAIELVRALAGYVFATGNRFAIGHTLAPTTPIAPGQETAIAALAFADDPELGDIVSDHGRAGFLEVVGITLDELALVQEWSTEALIELLEARSPLLVTDLARRSLLDDPHVAAEIHRRVTLEGSSEAIAHAPELRAELDGDSVCLVLEAPSANVVARAMRGRLRHGRAYELRGRAWSVVLEPSDVAGYRNDADDAHTVILEITPDVASELEAMLDAAPIGRHQLRSWSRLLVDVR